MSPEILQQISFFSSLPQSELDRLAHALTVRRYSAGEILFREGDTGESLYIVIDGSLEVVLGLDSPDEKVLATLGSGEYIGEMGLFMPGGHRTATARIKTDARLWEMTGPDFEGLLSRQPQLFGDVIRVLSKRLSRTNYDAYNDLLVKNQELQRAYDDLKAAQRQIIEKEKLEKELMIARDIQMSFLRDDFPPYPERAEFDLYAALEPAKEVGGDLYDFFLLDDDHLFFYVGDVSDKGVPAALFMAVTITLFKRIALEVGPSDPAEILAQANRALVLTNEKLLFVTLCCAILDLRTGEMVYSNAGHNPPLVIRAEGETDWLPLPDGLVLGVMTEATYSNRIIQLAPGDQLLFYTDGVTEAMNSGHELYSEERLIALASRLSADTPTEVVTRVAADVKLHSGGYAQSDDITVLAVKLADGAFQG